MSTTPRMAAVVPPADTEYMANKIDNAQRPARTALGIDVGSTTVSFDLTDPDSGRELTSRTVPNDARLPGRPYEVLYDAGRLLTIIQHELEDFLRGVRYPAPSCIGVTGQMHGILYVDADGNAASPLYSWMDGTGAQPHPAFGGRSAAEYVKAVTGLSMATGWGMATLLNHMASGTVPGNARGICTIDDYVVLKLTGRRLPLMHTSNAASLGLFDLSACRFDPAAISALALDPALLPEVTDDFNAAGSFRGIPVCVALGDNQASFLASVNAPGDTVVANIGTGSQLSFLSAEPQDRPGMEVRPLGGGEYIQVGASLCGGRALSLLEAFLRQTAELVTGRACESAYKGIDSCLDRLLEGDAAAALTHSLTVDTLFDGTRAEPWRRGAITGIGTDNFTPEELIKGFMFGMAEELKAIYDGSGGTGARILVATGGAVRKSAYLRCVLAQVFGMELLVPACVEAAAYGSTLAAAVAAGVLPSISEARQRIKYL